MRLEPQRWFHPLSVLCDSIWLISTNFIRWKKGSLGAWTCWSRSTGPSIATPGLWETKSKLQFDTQKLHWECMRYWKFVKVKLTTSQLEVHHVAPESSTPKTWREDHPAENARPNALPSASSIKLLEEVAKLVCGIGCHTMWLGILKKIQALNWNH